MPKAVQICVVVGIACMSANSIAGACSSRGSEEQLAMAAQNILQKSEIIADVEILDRSTAIPHLQRCDALILEAASECDADPTSNRCEELGDRIAVDCMEDGAAYLKIVKMWKGDSKETQQSVFTKDVPCGWIYDPEVGAVDTVCGYVDSEGLLHMMPCQNDGDVLTRYKSEWSKLHSAAENSPTSAAALNQLIEFSMHWNDRKAAAEAHSKICKLTTTEVASCLSAGRLLIDLGDYQAAQSNLLLALDRDPRNQDANQLLMQAKNGLQSQ